MQCHRLPASTASGAVTRTANPVATTSERPTVATTNATSNATVAPRRRARSRVANVHNQVRTIVSPGSAGRETASAMEANVRSGGGPVPGDLPGHSPALP